MYQMQLLLLELFIQSKLIIGDYNYHNQTWKQCLHCKPVRILQCNASCEIAGQLRSKFKFGVTLRGGTFGMIQFICYQKIIPGVRYC